TAERFEVIYRGMPGNRHPSSSFATDSHGRTPFATDSHGRTPIARSRSRMLPPRASHPNRSEGFTLIELLVVLAIVGILASVSMAIYRSARVRAGETSAVTTLHAINQA